MRSAVSGGLQEAAWSRNNADQQQALIVLLGIRSRQCAVDSFSDHSEGLCSILQQQWFKLFEPEFDSVFFLRFENAIRCNQQKIARQQIDGVSLIGRSSEQAQRQQIG